jgi:hypothetical protein
MTMAFTRSSLLKSSYTRTSSISMPSVAALYLFGRLSVTKMTLVGVEQDAGTWETEISLNGSEE